ncbi:MAG: AMP-binding protein [Bacteroidota bacterium]
MEQFDFKFYKWEKELADQTFLRQPFGDTWETYTWKEIGHMARKIATGLQALGLPPKSHIGLVSKNCREWIIADIAITMSGHVSVPFFPTLTADQISQVLTLGDVKALFVGKMEVWEDMGKGVPADMPIIKFPHYQGNSRVERGEDWHEFMNRYEPLEGNPQPNLDDIWTIIFTSGTTGTPKGVILTYRQMESTKVVIEETNPLKIDTKGGGNRFFSYLPLNHIAERIVVEATSIRYGGTISFSESLATFPKNLAETRPTVFFAVPRIWTKFQMGILSKIPQAKLDRLLKIPIVSGFVKKKIRKGLGLNDAKAWVSGAAPLSQSLRDWYKKLGIYITNGYGMTENAAICTTLYGFDDKPGSVGKAQAGATLKIDPDNGEIMMKAPYVMEGYYNAPEKTAEVLQDGWLRTGDQGYIDEDGYLFITGRIKDTFKTAKGKFIVPAPIEFKFEQNSDVEQICLVGLGCPQPLALVVPSEIGIAKSKDQLKDSLNHTLTQVNKELPNYQKVSTMVVVKEPWSVENGCLTPTLKIKRNVVNQQYQEQLMPWHEAPEQVVIE